MVLVWTITAEKVLGLILAMRPVVVPRMMIIVIVVVPVGTNIDNNESVFSMDDDTRDSGCSVDAETEWRVPRIKDCP